MPRLPVRDVISTEIGSLNLLVISVDAGGRRAVAVVALLLGHRVEVGEVTRGGQLVGTQSFLVSVTGRRARLVRIDHIGELPQPIGESGSVMRR